MFRMSLLTNKVSLKNLSQNQYTGAVSLRKLVQDSYNTNNTYYDPFFYAVALLCHFDGTSGSTTVTDSTSKTIVNSALQISNVQKVFGTCSLSCSGTNTVRAESVAFGSSDFTIEFWIYPTANNKVILSNNVAGTITANLWQISLDSTNKIIFTYYSSGAVLNITGSAVSLNAWTNVAVTRVSNNFNIFINGALSVTTSGTGSLDNQNSFTSATITSTTVSGNLLNMASTTGLYVNMNVQFTNTAPTGFAINTTYIISTVNAGSIVLTNISGTTMTVSSAQTGLTCNLIAIYPVYIGRTSTGYIDELRITLGYARYISSFSVLNIAFPNYSNNYDPYFTNVALLLKCESLTDSSPNNYSLTGTPVFTANIGGNTTKSLNMSSASGLIKTTAAISFGVQSFTIEFNMYIPTSAVQPATPFILGNTTNGTYGLNNWYVSLSSLKIVFNVNNNGSALFTQASTLSTNTWNHIAIVRNTNTVSLYINGLLDTSVGYTGSLDGDIKNIITVGSDGASTWYLSGYLDDIRITKNIARYTRNFPKPLVIPSTITYSSLKGNSILYNPVLYIDANSGLNTAVTLADLSGNTNNLSTSTNILGTVNALNYFNLTTSTANSAGISLNLGSSSLGTTFIAFTQPQPYQSVTRTLYGTTGNPSLVINAASSNLGIITGSSTFNYLYDTAPLTSTYNMLSFRSQFNATQFTLNNSSNTYIVSQPLPSVINTIGGYWGNIVNAFAYNTVLSDSQISDIYTRFTNRYIYNMPPVNVLNITYNVLNVIGSLITLVSLGSLNLSVGQRVSFTNIPASAGISPYISYYITEVTVTNDTFDPAILYTRIKVSTTASGSAIIFPHAYTVNAITGATTCTLVDSTGLGLFSGLQINITSPTTNGLTSSAVIQSISGNTVTFTSSSTSMININPCAIPFTITPSGNYSVTAATASTVTVNTAVGLSNGMTVQYLGTSYTITGISGSVLTLNTSSLITGTGLSNPLYIVSTPYMLMSLVSTYSITDTFTGANLFKVSSTTGLSPGLRIQFSGTVPANLGTITVSTDYYILSVPDSSTFTISSTLNGSQVTVTNNTAITGLTLNIMTTYPILSTNTNGFITVSVNYLTPGVGVQFSQNLIGGVATATTYYIVNTFVATNSFTISTSSSLTPVFAVSTATSCINMSFTGLLSYYSGDSLDGAGTWNDLISGNNISQGVNTLKTYTSSKKDSTNTVIQGLNNYKYLGGNTSSIVIFPFLLDAANYTFIWVARYAGIAINTLNTDVNTDSGAGNSKYIFTNISYPGSTGDYTTPYKWISGFSNVTSGVAIHNNWSATQASLGNNWIIGVDQNNLFRANGVNVAGNTNISSGKFKIGINDPTSTNKSDFMIATAMFFNYKLPLSSILLLENWLATRYSISIKVHLLDGLSAKAGYGIFRLSSTYTGPTLRIRRASDNVLMNFYADINGNLGTDLNGAGQSVSSWLVSSIGYIDILYDQSGMGNHATQSTTTVQPVYDPVNRYIDFSGSRYFALPDGTVPSGDTAYTVTLRYNTVNTATNSVATFLSSGGTSAYNNNSFAVTRSANSTGGSYNHYWTNSTTNNFTTADTNINVIQNTVSFTYSSADKNRIYVNNKSIGSATTINSARSSTTRNNYIGVNSTGAAEYLNGQLYYLCIFNSLLSSSDRSTIEYAAVQPDQITGFAAYSIGYTNVKLTWNAPKIPTAYVIITWAATDGSGNTDTSASTYTQKLYNGTNTFDTASSYITLNSKCQYIFTITPYNLADVAGNVTTVTVTTREPTILSYATSSTINSFTYTFIPSGGFDSYLLSYYDFTRSMVYQVTQISGNQFTYTNTSGFTMLFANAPVQFYVTRNDYTNPISNSIVPYNTVYYIRSGFTNNTFTLSASVGGAQATFTGVTGFLTLVLSSYLVTASTTSTFTYTNSDTSTKLTQWAPVKFSGTTFGGVNTTTVYYINAVTNTTFTLSSTPSPTVTAVTLTAGSGSMTMTIQSGNASVATDVTNAIKSPVNTQAFAYTVTGCANGTFTYNNSSSFTYIAVGSTVIFTGTVYSGLTANFNYSVATATNTTFTLTGITGINGSVPMNVVVYTVTTPYIISYGTTSNNTLRCDNTVGLFAGTPVQFLGATFGGVGSGTTAAPTIYYIISSNLTSTTFSVSQTSGGSAVGITTSYGSMFMSIVYQCTATATNGNITLSALVSDNNTRLFIGQMVQFSGTLIGGLSSGTTYFILSVLNNGTTATITVSLTPGGSLVGLTSGTSTGFTMIMTTGYFTTPAAQSLITLDLYNVSIMPYNTNVLQANKKLVTPLLLQIQTAKVYTMPNATTGFSLNTYPLYIFSSFTFTNAGITGTTGPNLATLRSNSGYSAQSWTQDTTNNYLNMTADRQGIQLWTVPFNGTYQIIAAGAGADPTGSYGLIVYNSVILNSGDVISILVGQKGTSLGGGGGTFVVKGSTVLLVAGGCGANGAAPTLTPTLDGGSGGGANGGCGGGGYSGNGGNDPRGNNPGTAFINGGYGGGGGGFGGGGGGGGGGTIGFGGGGGYNGGSGGFGSSSGGSCYDINGTNNTATLYINSITANGGTYINGQCTGNGFVIIYSYTGYGGAFKLNLTLSSDTIPAGISWSAGNSLTNAPFTSAGSTSIAYSADTIPKPLSITSTGLLGNTNYYVQMTASGFSLAQYTAASYSVTTSSAYKTNNASITNVAASSITYNSAIINWTVAGIPSGIPGTLYISTANTTPPNPIIGSLNISDLSNGTLSTTGITLNNGTNYYAIIKYSTGTYSTVDVYGVIPSYFTTLTLGSITFTTPTITYNSIVFNFNWFGYTNATYTIRDGNNNPISGYNNISITNSTTSISASSLSYASRYYITIVTSANSYGPGGTYGGSGVVNADANTYGLILFSAPNITYNSIAFNITWYGYTNATYTIRDGNNNPISGYNNISITNSTTSISASSLSYASRYYITIVTSANSYGPGGTYGGSGVVNADANTYGLILFSAPNITYNSIAFNITWYGYTNATYTIRDGNNNPISGYNNISITNSTTSVSISSLPPSSRYYITILTSANSYDPSATFGGSGVTYADVYTLPVGTLSFITPSTSYNFVTFRFTITDYTGVSYIIYKSDGTVAKSTTSINLLYQYGHLMGYLTNATPATTYYIVVTCTRLTFTDTYGSLSTTNAYLTTNGIIKSNYINTSWSYITNQIGSIIPTSISYSFTALSTINPMIINGIQTWTAPCAGTYRIIAAGAGIGTSTYVGSSSSPYYGGRGSVVSTTITLSFGDTLYILVGQSIATTNIYNGMGGTFVVKNGGTSGVVPVLVAGGGGGATNATNGTGGDATLTPGGGGGGNGGNDWASAGGGGFYGAGGYGQFQATLNPPGGNAFVVQGNYEYPPVSISNISGNNPYTGTISGQTIGNGTYIIQSSIYQDPPYYIFDKDNNTYWSTGIANYSNLAYYGTTSTIVSGIEYYGEWIQISCPQLSVITAYTLQANNSNPNNMPYSWIIAASIDGSIWYLLDSRTSQTFTSGGTGNSPYSITSNTNSLFSYYRLIVQTVNSQYSDRCYIGEFKLNVSKVIDGTSSPTTAAGFGSAGGYRSGTNSGGGGGGYDGGVGGISVGNPNPRAAGGGTSYSYNTTNNVASRYTTTITVNGVTYTSGYSTNSGFVQIILIA